ncbi:hypothetical protein GCM10009860_13560 [Microbacterium mitrae]
MVGSLMQSGLKQEIAEASVPREVIASVELKPYALPQSVGTVAPATTFEYFATQQPAIVTAMAAEPGKVMVSGEMLFSINDQPVFALELDVLPWRDLVVGTTGSDVAALNDALHEAGLRSDPGGSAYDELTVRAVSQMYTNAGSSAPGETPGASLARDAIAAVPRGDFVVVTAVGRGIAVTTGPVVTAQQNIAVVQTIVDPLTVKAIEVGSEAEITRPGSGSLGTGLVTEIGDFAPADPQAQGGSTKSGYPVVIALDSQDVAAAGEQVQVHFSSNEATDLAVPTIAIRQSSGRTWVVLKEGDVYTEVDVTPIWQQGGWTGVTGSEAIQDGASVVVSASVK